MSRIVHLPQFDVTYSCTYTDNKHSLHLIAQSVGQVALLTSSSGAHLAQPEAAAVIHGQLSDISQHYVCV